ncbi:MAG: lipase family protein, partial [Gammaproteobacteria bacterium]
MAFEPGFSFYEAKECLALSADVESENTPSMHADQNARAALTIHSEGSAAKNAWPLPTPKPDNWDLVVNPTDSIGLDNYWRLYRSKDNPHCYAVAVRGTIATAKSVFADLMVGMIKAESRLQIKESGNVPGFQFNFKLAEQQYAGVHHGFLYSLGALINPNWEFSLIKHLKTAVENGASEFYITGHSQGAAIATLLRAYLEYQPIGDGISYKTYVFAQPKPGND